MVEETEVWVSWQLSDPLPYGLLNILDVSERGMLWWKERISVFLLIISESILEYCESFLSAYLRDRSPLLHFGVFLDILERGEVLIILFAFFVGGEFVLEFWFLIAAAEGHD